MPRGVSGRRYAQAAFDLAMEKNELDSWQKSLVKAVDLSKDEKLMELLENPKLPFEFKQGILKKQLKGINPLALNLVGFLMVRGGLKSVGDISREYDNLLDAHRGVSHAAVLTAIALDSGTKKGMATRIEKILGGEVVIDAQVDPAMIGGVRAKVGDMLIDGSISSRLKSLRNSLAESK